MAVAIEVSFLSATQKLTKADQGRVLTFVSKFFDNPAHPSLSLERVQQAMEMGTPYHTRLDPPPAHGWTPPDITLEVVTGQQSDGVKEDTVANSSVDFPRCAAPIVSQPRLNFDTTA